MRFHKVASPRRELFDASQRSPRPEARASVALNKPDKPNLAKQLGKRVPGYSATRVGKALSISDRVANQFYIGTMRSY